MSSTWGSLERGIRPVARRDAAELAGLRRAARVVMEILEVLRAAVRPGITTGELDALAVRELAARRATSNFKGYVPAPGVPAYPGVICASVNEQIVHGIPGARELREGDIVSLDFGAVVEGWHGDSAITVPVGTVAPEVAHLLEVTQDALRRGIAQARAGNRPFHIGGAIQRYVRSEGCAVIKRYTGHGIGRAMHEDPIVPNYVDLELPNPLLRPGMVLCIEPMVAAGRPATREIADRWTVVTADGHPASHFEHMVVITDGDPEILTVL